MTYIFLCFIHFSSGYKTYFSYAYLKFIYFTAFLGVIKFSWSGFKLKQQQQFRIHLLLKRTHPSIGTWPIIEGLIIDRMELIFIYFSYIKIEPFLHVLWLCDNFFMNQFSVRTIFINIALLVKTPKINCYTWQ